MADSPVLATVLEEAAPAEKPVDPREGAFVEELLVEEVSIDGMCGVY